MNPFKDSPGPQGPWQAASGQPAPTQVAGIDSMNDATVQQIADQALRTHKETTQAAQRALKVCHQYNGACETPECSHQ